MTVIFLLSSLPARAIPRLDAAWDLLVKKLAHITGYALLAFLLARAIGPRRRGAFLWAFVFAVVYAASDEVHQSFVPGRNAAVLDIGIDAFGACLGLVSYRCRENAEPQVNG